jgi:hypothetical protein
MSNKVNFSEFKYEIKEINNYCYCIFADETNYNYYHFLGTDYQKFNKLYKDIYELFYNRSLEPLMLIVCTQNSKSCTKLHFQHLIKNIINKITSESNNLNYGRYWAQNIRLIDKADATTTNNSSTTSCLQKMFKKNPYNCRTRIYCNKYLYSNEYKNSDNKIIRKNMYKSSSDILINSKTGLPMSILKSIPYREEQPSYRVSIESSKNKLFVKKCEKRIINISSEGSGAILFDIIIENTNGYHQRFIICNSNLPADSSERILTDLKKEFNYRVPFNFIMATPNISEIEKINTENKAREIFPNKSNIMIEQKLNNGNKRIITTIASKNPNNGNNKYTQMGNLGNPGNKIGNKNL